MTVAAAVPARTPAPAAPSRMSLSAVTRGKLLKPRRVLLYGPEGIGKSTFGAGFPGAIFLAPEDGTAQIDVARFPEPSSWADVMAAVDVLMNEPHDYRTLVVDTLDWLEPKIHADVCLKHRWDNIEDPDYGKGLVAALVPWRSFLARLDELRAARSMEVVLLAHSQVKPFKDPQGPTYDRFELKLAKNASGLVKEWADAVLFTNYETLTTEKNKRVIGVSTGARFIHTQRTAAFDAKNRYNLPPTLPLSAADFDAAVRLGQSASPDALRSEIDALLAQVDADTKSKAEAWLSQPANITPSSLAQMADRLRARAAILNPSNGAESAQKESA